MNPPQFEKIEEKGPSHKKVFVWQCVFNNIIGQGIGSNKKIAKDSAAKEVITKINFDDLPLKPVSKLKQKKFLRVKMMRERKKLKAAHLNSVIKIPDLNFQENSASTNVNGSHTPTQNDDFGIQIGTVFNVGCENFNDSLHNKDKLPELSEEMSTEKLENNNKENAYEEELSAAEKALRKAKAVTKSLWTALANAILNDDDPDFGPFHGFDPEEIERSVKIREELKEHIKQTEEVTEIVTVKMSENISGKEIRNMQECFVRIEPLQVEKSIFTLEFLIKVRWTFIYLEFFFYPGY